MERNLMAREDMSSLGFRDPNKSEPQADSAEEKKVFSNIPTPLAPRPILRKGIYIYIYKYYVK